MSRSSIVALQPIYMRLNGPFGTPPVVVGVFVAVCVTKVPFLALISAFRPTEGFMTLYLLITAHRNALLLYVHLYATFYIWKIFVFAYNDTRIERNEIIMFIHC